MQIFGFEFKRKETVEPQSFTTRETDDGATVVSATGASYGTSIDLDTSIRNEAEMITRYRDMSFNPEVDMAIDEIINETISVDENDIVNIILDEVELSENIKTKITEEFKNTKNLLDFDNQAYQIYKRWYVDGRLNYHVLIDKDRPNEGIKELRYIDPRKIKKIREVSAKKVDGTKTNVVVQQAKNEYFVFNERGFNTSRNVNDIQTNTTALKIAKDSIISITSGITDVSGSIVLSHLQKSMKPLTQLRTMEDSLVIYRLARAPERRVWRVDVGNMPKIKAEQYMESVMSKHKNKLVYDQTTGQIKDSTKFLTMLEDYWLPVREGGKGTDVTTLPSGQNLNQMDDVLYFQKKFLQSLNVPVNRLNSDALFSIGRATEVSRDEVKFSKFIARLRIKFATLFTEILGKQLVLKGIMTIEDFNNISSNIRYDFARDNYFTELKDSEILQNRMGVVEQMQAANVIGVTYSWNWVRKNILKQTDDDIKEQDKIIIQEVNSGDPRWVNQNIATMQQEQQAHEQEQQNQQDGASNNNDKGNGDKVSNAEQVVKIMEPKKNKTPSELSRYQSAVQILAKNK